tara:strand:+ start:1752 stop:2294 length:543 start_codon:yes stop_codon:yes gene_type:complete
MRRTGKPAAIMLLMFSSCATPQAEPALDDSGPLSARREAPPQTNLDGASIGISRVEDNGEYYVVWFRLLNRSDKTWQCAGFDTPKVRERLDSVCLIKDPDIYYMNTGGDWHRRKPLAVISFTTCPVPWLPVERGEAATFFWHQRKDDARDFAVGTSVRVEGVERRVYSSTITRESLPRLN